MLDEISWSSFLNVSGALSDYLSSICGILNYEKLAEHSFLLIGAWRLCVCGGVFVVWCFTFAYDAAYQKSFVDVVDGVDVVVVVVVLEMIMLRLLLMLLRL